MKIDTMSILGNAREFLDARLFPGLIIDQATPRLWLIKRIDNGTGGEWIRFDGRRRYPFVTGHAKTGDMDCHPSIEDAIHTAEKRLYRGDASPMQQAYPNVRVRVIGTSAFVRSTRDRLKGRFVVIRHLENACFEVDTCNLKTELPHRTFTTYESALAYANASLHHVETEAEMLTRIAGRDFELKSIRIDTVLLTCKSTRRCIEIHTIDNATFTLRYANDLRLFDGLDAAIIQAQEHLAVIRDTGLEPLTPRCDMGPAGKRERDARRAWEANDRRYTDLWREYDAQALERARKRYPDASPERLAELALEM